MVKGPGVECEGRGDLGVRFDRLNELRGAGESRGPLGVRFDHSTFRQTQGIGNGIR